MSILHRSMTVEEFYEMPEGDGPAGTRLVWVIDPDPERETVTAYRSLLSPRVFAGNDELDGEDVVPGFRIRVGEVFAA